MPKSQPGQLEIIYLRPEGEWYRAQCALNGVLSPPFEFHRSAREQFLSEPEFMAYLVRQTAAMIEQFGDAQHERMDDITKYN